ncbi:hypothetical protein Tco_0528829 [Tanacetum coccineum]
MEAHLLRQPTQVNKVTTSCEICSGPHDTQYCMEDPKQAFVEYISSVYRLKPGSSINTVTIHFKQQSDSFDEKAIKNEEEEKDSPENILVNPSTPPNSSVTFITEKFLKFNSFFESLRLVPKSSDIEVVCIKRDNGDVMFIKINRKHIDFSAGGEKRLDLKGKGVKQTEGVGVEYFGTIPK